MPTNTAKLGSVYANELGASIMSDGKLASITVPNGSTQQRLTKKALEWYGVKPCDVDFIEAHRTGTALRNPIVIEALAEVFAQPKTKSHPLMVGSVKSNIGHLECAAGIVGLIKAVLILTQECTPPNVGLNDLNPLIGKTIQSYEFPIKFPT